MPNTPQQYFFDFSNDFCDNFTTSWGVRRLNWGKGAAYDMEGFTHLLKMLPHPCYDEYSTNIANNTTWSNKFADFKDSGLNKLALPYKFLQIIDPDAFLEIQQTHFHSVAHAIRNAADLSRACDIFFRAKKENSIDPFYEWEGRGATEPMYYYAYNSLVKSLIFSGPNIIDVSESDRRYMGGPSLVCGPVLLGARYGCVCPQQSQCPPQKKQCMKGADEECNKKSGMALAECASEPWPRWPSGQIPLGVGFPTDTENGYIHAGYFLRKSYAGYGSFIQEAGTINGIKDPAVLVEYAQSQNGFDYHRPQFNAVAGINVYGSRRRLPAPPPIKRIKSIMKVDNANQAKDFLYNGYGIVLSTNVGFSQIRDSIGVSYPDRIWYHTMSIIGYDDTRSIHPECLFLIQNSWGNWNFGGQPNWGPLPQGSFLITQYHLDCILSARPQVEQINDCNDISRKRCLVWSREDVNIDIRRPPTSLIEIIDNGIVDRIIERSENVKWVRFTCDNKRAYHNTQNSCERALVKEARESENCGNNCFEYDSCGYRRCGSNQSPWGIAFAISFDDDPPFMRKKLKYEQFYNTQQMNTENCVSASTATGRSSWDTSGISSDSFPITLVYNTSLSKGCDGQAIGQQYGRIQCFLDLTEKSNLKFKIEGDATINMLMKVLVNNSTLLEKTGEGAGCSGEDISEEVSITLDAGRHYYTMIVEAGVAKVPETAITFTIEKN